MGSGMPGCWSGSGNNTADSPSPLCWGEMEAGNTGTESKARSVSSTQFSARLIGMAWWTVLLKFKAYQQARLETIETIYVCLSGIFLCLWVRSACINNDTSSATCFATRPHGKWSPRNATSCEPPLVEVDREEEYQVSSVEESQTYHNQSQYLIRWTRYDLLIWKPTKFVEWLQAVEEFQE